MFYGSVAFIYELFRSHDFQPKRQVFLKNTSRRSYHKEIDHRTKVLTKNICQALFIVLEELLMHTRIESFNGNSNPHMARTSKSLSPSHTAPNELPKSVPFTPDDELHQTAQALTGDYDSSKFVCPFLNNVTHNTTQLNKIHVRITPRTRQHSHINLLGIAAL